jgi:hypothetical protein
MKSDLFSIGRGITSPSGHKHLKRSRLGDQDDPPPCRKRKRRRELTECLALRRSPCAVWPDPWGVIAWLHDHPPAPAHTGAEDHSHALGHRPCDQRRGRSLQPGALFPGGSSHRRAGGLFLNLKRLANKPSLGLVWGHQGCKSGAARQANKPHLSGRTTRHAILQAIHPTEHLGVFRVCDCLCELCLLGTVDDDAHS